MSRTLTVPGLPPDHARFVTEFISLGGRPEDGPAAALRAGVAKNARDAELTARILLESRNITQAIKNEVKNRFDLYAGAAARTIYDLSQNARSEQTRLAASQEILNRSIGAVPSRSASVNMNVKSIEDLIGELDSVPLNSEVIDAEAVPVTPQAPALTPTAPPGDTLTERMARDAEQYAEDESCDDASEDDA